MKEFELQIIPSVGKIDFNLNELKENLKTEMESYKNMIVSEETLPGSKKDLAFLRKVRKELNDRKIAVKKEFMAPYDAFESEIKEALALIDEPITQIDKQVKEFEEEAKKAKRSHCAELFAETLGELIQYIPFEKVFKESWLNATTKDKDIIDDLQVAKISVQNDVNAIIALDSEIQDRLFDTYIENGLAAAIKQNSDYLALKKEAEESVVKVPAGTEVKSMNEPELVIKVVGLENIEKLKQMLDFSEIPYTEV